ncbi:vomeronasal type-2 receptor 26-like [Podarcis lilfordi]|nr:vomeronasal type-2 receptor 26-like [Podarcis lilfordi]
MASITWLSRWRHLFGLLVLYQWTIVCGSDSQVTQSPLSQNIQEGGLFAITCSNPNEYRTHFWYHQQPGRAPTLLLYIAPQDKNKTKGRFTAEYLEKGKKSRLHLSGAQIQDSGQGQAVTQDSFVSAEAGEPTQLNCSYSGSPNTLRWYKQHPSGQIQSMALLYNSQGEAIIQKDSFVSARAGEHIQLHCSYTGTLSTLQWYKQHLSGQIQWLASLYTKSTTEPHGYFSLSLNTKEKFTSLTLHNTQVGDSLVYFCAESRSAAKTHPASHKTCCQGSHSVSGQGEAIIQKDTFVSVMAGEHIQLNFLLYRISEYPAVLHTASEWTDQFMASLYKRFLQCEAQIFQDPFVEASDGRKLNLSCTHSDSSQSIHWYRQQPNQTVQFIVSGYSSGVKSNSPEGVLLVAGDRKSNVFSFNKVTLEDSAVYYCALSDTVLHPGVSAV